MTRSTTPCRPSRNGCANPRYKVGKISRPVTESRPTASRVFCSMRVWTRTRNLRPSAIMHIRPTPHQTTPEYTTYRGDKWNTFMGKLQNSNHK